MAIVLLTNISNKAIPVECEKKIQNLFIFIANIFISCCIFHDIHNIFNTVVHI